MVQFSEEAGYIIRGFLWIFLASLFVMNQGVKKEFEMDKILYKRMFLEEYSMKECARRWWS